MKKKTKDIRLAAAFLLFGAKICKVDRTDPRHQEFEFETKDAVVTDEKQQVTVQRELNLDEIEQKWVNGDLVGNLFLYAECFQRMKAVIHSQ